MKLKNIAVFLLVLTICVSLMTGCGGEDDPYKGLVLYEHPVGISLYMEKGFSETEIDGVLGCYQGEIANVRFGKDTFEALAEVGYTDDMTESEYAKLVIAAYGLDSEVKTDGYGNVYIAYVENISGADVSYYAFFNKSTDAFWMTTFMCMTEYAEKLEDDFCLWASSISVK
ncbi:MAG: hypothetical protein IJ017_05975 [Oscillospiraceae bacterium]|nr:hypothetical protein [Oscillospiraceae bacterium]